MRPRWKKVEEEDAQLETSYYDFDESQPEVEKYNIEDGKLPVFVFLDKDGHEIERRSGEISIGQIKEIIGRLQNK